MYRNSRRHPLMSCFNIHFYSIPINPNLLIVGTCYQLDIFCFESSSIIANVSLSVSKEPIDRAKIFNLVLRVGTQLVNLGATYCFFFLNCQALS